MNMRSVKTVCPECGREKELPFDMDSPLHRELLRMYGSEPLSLVCRECTDRMFPINTKS